MVLLTVLSEPVLPMNIFNLEPWMRGGGASEQGEGEGGMYSLKGGILLCSKCICGLPSPTQPCLVPTAYHSSAQQNCLCSSELFIGLQSAVKNTPHKHTAQFKQLSPNPLFPKTCKYWTIISAFLYCTQAKISILLSHILLFVLFIVSLLKEPASKHFFGVCVCVPYIRLIILDTLLQITPPHCASYCIYQAY